MKKAKLLGVEFGRGLSTYAVVLVHSGDETWGIPIDSVAIAFRHFFYFAVPFFMATAFYFMTGKPDVAYTPRFWKSRLDRIVVPYAVWSIIFFISRLLIFTLTNKTEQLQKLVQDPLSIMFLGAASYHLYFLPLLLTGTLLVFLSPWLEQLKLNISDLITLCFLSVFIYYLVEASGNSFDLSSYTAFQKLELLPQFDFQKQPLIRLIVVGTSWMIRCVPYFLIAFTLNRLSPSSKESLFKLNPLIWATPFLLINLGLKNLLPGILAELFLAFLLLLFCISLSNYIRDKRGSRVGPIENYFASAGMCSFGIYLCHPFCINLVKPVLGLAFPGLISSVSINSMLLLSLLSFFVSWSAVTYLSRNKFLSKYLFGV